ncbi:MAG: hypothetical protein HY084_01795 [Gemmatimonadetes bacterium]|nr:hypothetical protein [Gemmatimonadota bacterium]
MTETLPPPPRRPYRPPIGIPLPKQNRAGGAVASVFLHLLIILLLIGPFWVRQVILTPMEDGGGPGARGGGGGGNGGTGGIVQERLRYMVVQPPPPPPVPKPVPVVAPPVVKPPEPEKPKPEPPKAAPQPDAAKDASQVIGTGGGTGHDGSAGSGPGSGGGVGSGVGTGRGSATGPGTGGGAGRIYPPSVTTLALLPLPVPSKVKPYTLVARFEVDEKGNGKLIDWTPSKDSDYNKKVKAMLEEVRFRPAVRSDGTPVKATYQITAQAY